MSECVSCGGELDTIFDMCVDCHQQLELFLAMTPEEQAAEFQKMADYASDEDDAFY